MASYAHKKNTLITLGPYSISRNPLYFFSFLGALGVGLATETLAIPFILAVAFGLYYPFIIRDEESTLKKLHGTTFEDYVRRVPRFFPKISLLNEPAEYSVQPRIYRKHIFSALWFIWIIGFLELIEGLHELNILPTWFPIY